jgi:hypothetical protein
MNHKMQFAATNFGWENANDVLQSNQQKRGEVFTSDAIELLAGATEVAYG